MIAIFRVTEETAKTIIESARAEGEGARVSGQWSHTAPEGYDPYTSTIDPGPGFTHLDHKGVRYVGWMTCGTFGGVPTFIGAADVDGKWYVLAKGKRTAMPWRHVLGVVEGVDAVTYYAAHFVWEQLNWEERRDALAAALGEPIYQESSAPSWWKPWDTGRTSERHAEWVRRDRERRERRLEEARKKWDQYHDDLARVYSPHRPGFLELVESRIGPRP